jgi:hypothetical protein
MRYKNIKVFGMLGALFGSLLPTFVFGGALPLANPVATTTEVPIVGVYHDLSASVTKSVGLQIVHRHDMVPLDVVLLHLSGRKNRIPDDYQVLMTQSLFQGLTALGHDTRGLTITVFFSASYEHSGPSMTAMIVIAAATVLDEKKLKPGHVITGTVEPNGTIGQVGQLDEKLAGAKSSGYRALLHPASQEPNHTIEGIKAIPVATLADAIGLMQASPYDPS